VYATFPRVHPQRSCKLGERRSPPKTERERRSPAFTHNLTTASTTVLYVGLHVQRATITRETPSFLRAASQFSYAFITPVTHHAWRYQLHGLTRCEGRRIRVHIQAAVVRSVVFLGPTRRVQSMLVFRQCVGRPSVFSPWTHRTETAMERPHLNIYLLSPGRLARFTESSLIITLLLILLLSLNSLYKNSKMKSTASHRHWMSCWRLIILKTESAMAVKWRQAEKCSQLHLQRLRGRIHWWVTRHVISGMFSSSDASRIDVCYTQHEWMIQVHVIVEPRHASNARQEQRAWTRFPAVALLASEGHEAAVWCAQWFAKRCSTTCPGALTSYEKDNEQKWF